MGFKDKLKRTSKLFINDPNGNAANGTASNGAPAAEANVEAQAEGAKDKAVDEVDSEAVQAKAREEADKKINGLSDNVEGEVETGAQDAPVALNDGAAAVSETVEPAETAAPAEPAQVSEVVDDKVEGAAPVTEGSKVADATEAPKVAEESKDVAGDIPTTTKEKTAQAAQAKEDVKDSGYKNEKRDFLRRLFTKFKKNKGEKAAPATTAPATSEKAEAAVEGEANEHRGSTLSASAAKAAIADPAAEEAAPKSNDAAAAAAAASESKEVKLPEVERVNDEVQAAARALGEKTDEKVAATKEAIAA